MTKQDIETQIENVERLTDEMEISGDGPVGEIHTADLLDYLAIVGMKLVECGPDDFDEAGVSVISHAYHTHLARLAAEVQS